MSEYFRCKNCGEVESKFSLEMYAIENGYDNDGTFLCTTCENAGNENKGFIRIEDAGDEEDYF